MIRRLAPFMFSIAVVLAATLPMLSGHRVAFRDVSHFYLPLYDYVAFRTSTEWLPLWNPLDQMGMPLVGESTTAVLYPVRYAMFALPLETVTALNLYLAAHLVLASFGAAWLARRIQSSSLGVATAGVVYPLSGSVYALCCNPPFLVGAAWLPFALGASLLRGPSQRRRIALVSFSLAMMVLAGDPQTALHVTMVTVAVALVRGIRMIFVDSDVGGDTIAGPKSMFVVAVSAALLALALSSLQVVASLDWSRNSDRAASTDQRREAFDFSLPPWHLTELLSPRPFGEPFPRHRRLGVLVPGDGRMWTPSIYGGAIVGAAICCGLIRRRTAGQTLWLWIAVIAMLLCFGHFGLVWIIQQIPSALPDWDSAVGGPYWMLWAGIKGYAAFRYPVKWLPVFALAASMVAAQWMSSPVTQREVGLLKGLSLVSLVLAIGNEALLAFDYQADVAHADEYWGPLDQLGGWWIARNSWLISATCLAAFTLLLARQRGSQMPALFAIILISVDVGWSAQRMLPLISVDRETQVLDHVHPEDTDFVRTLRTQSGSWPGEWRSTSSDLRALEVAVSERASWFGRWHLADRAAVFNSTVSIRSRELARFWHAVNVQRRSMNRADQQVFWDAIRDWLAIDGSCHLDGERTIKFEGMDLACVLRFKQRSVSAVRVYTDWQTPQPMEQIISQLAVERRVLPAVDLDQAKPPAADRSTIKVLSESRIEVQSEGGCLLERCQLQDGHWRARLESSDGRTISTVVLPSSRLNQAVYVPAGNWTVQFEYRPWWKWPSLLVMAAACLVWARLWFARTAQIRRGD